VLSSRIVALNDSPYTNLLPQLLEAVPSLRSHSAHIFHCVACIHSLYCGVCTVRTAQEPGVHVGLTDRDPDAWAASRVRHHGNDLMCRCARMWTHGRHAEPGQPPLRSTQTGIRPPLQPVLLHPVPRPLLSCDVHVM
jgi:hypothetical protein